MTAFDTVWVDNQPFLIPRHGPAALPMDPADIEQLPPADIDACEHCDGLGARVVGFDEADRPLDDTCSWCDGSGNRRGWVGAA